MLPSVSVVRTKGESLPLNKILRALRNWVRYCGCADRKMLPRTGISPPRLII